MDTYVLLTNIKFGANYMDLLIQKTSSKVIMYSNANTSIYFFKVCDPVMFRAEISLTRLQWWQLRLLFRGFLLALFCVYVHVCLWARALAYVNHLNSSILFKKFKFQLLVIAVLKKQSHSFSYSSLTRIINYSSALKVQSY